MSHANRNDSTRRTFLKEVGASAAAIVGASEAHGLQDSTSARPGAHTQEKESTAKPARAEKPPHVRQEIDLTGHWRFQVDLYNEGEKVGYFSLDFPANDWREVSIPRAFDDCAPGMNKFRGICWFRRQFEVPVSLRGRRVVIRFEGVNYNCSVWVNGQSAGHNEDAFLPFEFPVDELLRYGEKNLVVVRVDNLRRPAQLPTTEYWQGQGGILREVKLVATDPARIAHVGITAAPENGKGKFGLVPW